MINVKKCVVAILSCIALMYLTVGFVTLDFNIATWDMESRALFVFITLIAVVPLSIGYSWEETKVTYE